MTVFNARTAAAATAATTATAATATTAAATGSPTGSGSMSSGETGSSNGSSSSSSSSITSSNAVVTACQPQPINPVPTTETAATATATAAPVAKATSTSTIPNVEDSNVVFPVGSTLECRNVLDSITVGQVICSDQPTRLLVLKDIPVAGTVPCVRIINLALVAQVSCVKEKAGDQALPWQNLQISSKQIQERMNRSIARKKASIMQADIPIEGQRAFIHLRKTLEHRVEWSGNNIKVLNRVLIRPPYTADSIEHIGDINDAAVASAKEHVRKILTKHRSTQQTRSPCDDAPADPTPSR